MNECGCVPMKLCLPRWVAGGIWSLGHILLAPDLESEPPVSSSGFFESIATSLSLEGGFALLPVQGFRGGQDASNLRGCA